MNNRTSNFEPFNGEFESFNSAFLTDDQKVMWVEKEWALEGPNPRDFAQSVFVTFDGDRGASDSPDRDDTPETLEEFAFDMGVEPKDIDPGYDDNGEYTKDVSYMDLLKASESLPEKILDAARENGYTILPVSTKVACAGLGKHYKAGLPTDKFEDFAGFIYSSNPNVTEKDLREEVRKYDAYVTFEIYKTTTYPLTELGNVDSTKPGEEQYFYGYDTDTNGFGKVQDVSRYLGTFNIPEDISQHKDLELMIENDNLAKEEISKFDFLKAPTASIDEVFRNLDPRPVDPVTRQYVGTVAGMRVDENNILQTEDVKAHNTLVESLKKAHAERYGTEKPRLAPQQNLPQI